MEGLASGEPWREAAREDENVDVILEAFFRQGIEHKRSQRLPENPAVASRDGAEQYDAVRDEYEVTSDQILRYNREHPAEIKQDYRTPNIAWKLHLNVEPRSVQEVSEYLLEEGYKHKFLRGGEIKEGKIFTVYVGSFGLTRSASNRFGEALAHALSRPVEGVSEVEFAPGVVGRFVASDNPEFHQYGSSGFSLLSEDYRQATRIRDHAERATFLRAAEKRAFLRLREKYGDYFFPSKGH